MQLFPVNFLNFFDAYLFGFNKNTDLYEFFSFSNLSICPYLLFSKMYHFQLFMQPESFLSFLKLSQNQAHNRNKNSSPPNLGGGMSCSFAPSKNLYGVTWCCCSRCARLAKCKKGDLYARPPVSEVCAYRTMLFCSLYFCITQ